MEEQAIARAVRMGQTRTVTIIRYVVERSVEEVRRQRSMLDRVGLCPIDNNIISEHREPAKAKAKLSQVHP